jgi:FkbM family methyltransferase
MNLIPTLLLERLEDVIQRQLGKGSGAWSTTVEAAAISHFINQKSIKTVVALDAGANKGDWSNALLMQFPEAYIFAFEPSQEAFAHLQKRFLSSKSVNCENIALGKVDGITRLYSDRSGSGLGSLTKRRVDHFNIDFNFEEEVEIQTLDSWMAKLEQELVPNILKMDVEGHEYDILLGATDSMKNIEIVQFEFGGSNIDTRTYFQDFWYFFKDHNFDLFRITPSQPILIHQYSEIDECFRATNYLAVRK